MLSFFNRGASNRHPSLHRKCITQESTDHRKIIHHWRREWTSEEEKKWERRILFRKVLHILVVSWKLSALSSSRPYLVLVVGDNFASLSLLRTLLTMHSVYPKRKSEWRKSSLVMKEEKKPTLPKVIIIAWIWKEGMCVGLACFNKSRMKWYYRIIILLVFTWVRGVWKQDGHHEEEMTSYNHQETTPRLHPSHLNCQAPRLYLFLAFTKPQTHSWTLGWVAPFKEKTIQEHSRRWWTTLSFEEKSAPREKKRWQLCVSTVMWSVAQNRTTTFGMMMEKIKDEKEWTNFPHHPTKLCVFLFFFRTRVSLSESNQMMRHTLFVETSGWPEDLSKINEAWNHWKSCRRVCCTHPWLKRDRLSINGTMTTICGVSYFNILRDGKYWVTPTFDSKASVNPFVESKEKWWNLLEDIILNRWWRWKGRRGRGPTNQSSILSISLKKCRSILKSQNTRGTIEPELCLRKKIQKTTPEEASLKFFVSLSLISLSHIITERSNEGSVYTIRAIDYEVNRNTSQMCDWYMKKEKDSPFFWVRVHEKRNSDSPNCYQEEDGISW
jgi:hypothetical protein